MPHTPHTATPGRQRIVSEVTSILSHLADWTGKYSVADEQHQTHGLHVVVATGILCRDPNGNVYHCPPAVLFSAASLNRWTISGSWPTDTEHHVHMPANPLRITISRAKTPAQIARDIERRFLEWYEPEFSRQVASAVEANAKFREREDTLTRLAAVIGIGEKSRSRNFENRLYVAGVGVEVCLDGTVRINTGYLECAEAEAVLATMKSAGVFVG